MANKENFECISFTEPPYSITQHRPKEFYAKLFLQSFLLFSEQVKNSKIALIKIIILEVPTLEIYKKELETLKNQTFETQITND